MAIQQYEFVLVEKLQPVYELKEIQGKPSKVYRRFIENDDEVIYILNNGMIYGLITIGDMYRYYRNEEKEVPINKKFSYVEEASDYSGAENFFTKVRTIHEIPVIKDKLLIGIIRKKQYQMTITKERLNCSLVFERMNTWRKEKFRQFHQKISASVFYYDMSPKLNTLTQEEQDILERRKCSSTGLRCFERMSEDEQKKFVGNKYHEKYMEQFVSDFRSLHLCSQKGAYKYADCCNETFHIVDGYRQISNAPGEATRKIWMFGLCTVFGHYVSDDETIAYYLQNSLILNGYANYEVMNAGTTAREYGRWWIEKISPDDIVIIVNQFIPMFNRWGSSKQEPVKEVFGNCYKGDLVELCMQLEQPVDCMVEGPPHCNYKLNEKIAEKMFLDLLPKLTKDNSEVLPRIALQDYFIPWDVTAYYEDYIEKYDLCKEEDKKTGAIVMNCNPFTLGHRYLIESACNQVDILYIFVVEEDKSYFKFEDRLEMVKQGTKDLEKVHVCPSGKYIISKETFAQYFEKDQVVTEVDDMDYDVRIFGEVVANMLGITCRFVGEEPFDKVTREYNETMKRILPEYGIELIEIPRKVENGICISASKVRFYLEEGEVEKAYALLPESTRKYLKL